MLKKMIFDLTKTFLTFFRILKNNRIKISVLPKEKNKNLIILGTGPSLKDILENHLEIINKYDMMTLNKFCTRPEFEVLRSKHYLLLDADFSTMKMSPKDMKLRDEVFDALIQKTSWNMNLYFPSNTDMREELNILFAQNPLINIVYFHMTTVEGLDSISFKLYEKEYGMPFAGNVLVSAILLGLNMGYKKLILFGADLSMHTMAAVNFESQLCLKELNYYENRMECEPQNETVHDYYFKTARTFESFHILNRYAKYKHAEIYNGSLDSFIDAYEKRKVEDIFLEEK